MFAGSLQKVTQTLPLAIYAQFDHDFDVDAHDERLARALQHGPLCQRRFGRTWKRSLLETSTFALRAFSLELSLEVGPTLALFGPSGAGKTTRPAVVAGLADPSGPDHVRTRTSGSTPRPESTVARRSDGRDRLPGVRPLPAPLGPGEHRVRAASIVPTTSSSASGSPPRVRAAGRALRRRAAARCARPCARAGAAGPAPRRAALRARRAHEDDGPCGAA